MARWPAPAHASSHAAGGADELTPAAIGALATAARGAANGVASLGADAKVPADQLPAGGGSTPEDWHVVGGAGEPAFGTNWGNFGGTWAVAGFCKMPDGEVLLKGLVANSAGTGSLIFTLPTGYRPAADRLFVTMADGVLGRVDVLADGSVMHRQGPSSWVSIEIGFRP